MTYKDAIILALTCEPGEWSARTLADDLGCSHATVRSVASEAGLSLADDRVLRRRRRKDEARRRYAEGHTLQGIARALGVSVPTVREYIGPVPSRRATDRIEAWLREHPGALGAREVADLFGVTDRLVRHVVARRGLRHLLFRAA